MATRLELAEQKLARLKSEFETKTQAAYSHMAQTNGQPMNDKRNGQAFFKKRDQLEQSIFNNLAETRKQEERVEMLKRVEYNKANHLTNAGGLQTSVHNIDKLKERKQDKATRDKIKLLEDIAEKAKTDAEIMTDKAKQLIADGIVKQWDKKPIYYFVAGLKKVAFVVDKNTGEFIVSKKYAPTIESDIATVQDILS